jgi:hypothetical protein
MTNPLKVLEKPNGWTSKEQTDCKSAEPIDNTYLQTATRKVES